MAAGRTGHHGPSMFEGKSLVDPGARPAWFTEHIETIPDAGRQLLEDYSGIPSEQVLPHVIAIVGHERTASFQLFISLVITHFETDAAYVSVLTDALTPFQSYPSRTPLFSASRFYIRTLHTGIM